MYSICIDVGGVGSYNSNSFKISYKVHIVGGVMATRQGWDPQRREKEVKEAVEELHKKRQATIRLRSDLEKRGGSSVLDGHEGGGRLDLESRPALREVLRERWRAEVGAINLLMYHHSCFK